MNKKILVTLIISVIIIGIFASVACVFSALYLFRSTDQVETSDKAASPVPDLPTITEETQTDTGEKNTKTDIPPQIQVEMELIQRQVIEERGLESTGVFTRVLFTREQLKERLVEDFREDYDPEEEKESAAVLDVFGLLNADFDLYNFYLDLLTEQISGFYDNETKEMVVVLGEGFEGPQRLTYAHEYTHALQDQNFDIQDGLNYNDDACEVDTERCAAIQALLEGDASLSELGWYQENATIEDQREILSFYSDLESPMLDSAPAFISEDLLFPYEAGYTFVDYLYQRGGWNAINAAYNSPPVSTEQILHPEKYPDDRPIEVPIPDLTPILGDDWEEIDRNVMGEWYIYLILAHGLSDKFRISETIAEEAAAGWGGDTYVVYHNHQQDSTVMALRALWESPSQAEEFINAFLDYAQGRFGKPVEKTPEYYSWDLAGYKHTLFIEDVYTTWISAPEQDIVTQVWDIIQGQ